MNCMNIRGYVKTVFEQEKPLKFLVSRILIRSKLCKLFIIKQKNYNLRFDPVSSSGALWINPNYYHSVNVFFSDYLKKGDKVIDIGANIGTVTIEASKKIGDSGKVYSIEPHPQIYKYFIGNIRLNRLKNVKTFNFALGNKDGTIFFSDKHSDDQNSIITNKNGIKIKLKKLDDLEINEDFIDLIILDAIGYEKFVVEGGKDILKRTKCVHFPVLEKFFKNFDYTYKDIFKIIENIGFKIYEFSEDRKISLVPENYKADDNRTITTLLGIRDLSDFLERTNYSLQN